MDNFLICRISTKQGKEYIHKYHYSHGSHNAPSPCYGLFLGERLIGVCMFATPCSENVRASLWGKENVNHVTELHRLHILDETPKNTESWFVSRVLKQLKIDKPQIWGVLSFSDLTEGHSGVIYQALNAYRIGQTSPANFYIDQTGRLRHPRQNGVNITKPMAKELGWVVERRMSKNRYLWLLPDNKRHKRELIETCRYNLKEQLFH